MSIHSIQLSTVQSEADYISAEILKFRESGQNLSQIAIIARKYKDLDIINQTLTSNRIPISFERGENVLDRPHIQWIVTILDFVNSLDETKVSPKDELLPEILTFPFWEIDPLSIYQVSITANRESRTWLEVIHESDDSKLKKVANFLLELGKVKNNYPVETLIEFIIEGKVTEQSLVEDE